MLLHDICLSCGHRKDEHSSDGSRCHNDLCPCLRFKTTLLQYGSGSSNNIPYGESQNKVSIVLNETFDFIVCSVIGYKAVILFVVHEMI